MSAGGLCTPRVEGKVSAGLRALVGWRTIQMDLEVQDITVGTCLGYQ